MASFNVPRLCELKRSDKYKLVKNFMYFEDGLQWCNTIATKMAAVDRAIAVYGDDRYFKYLKAMYHLERAALRRERRLKKMAHEERQATWFAGGREAHYIKKYGRYGANHSWLVAKIERRTGMCVGDGVEVDSVEEEEEQPVEAARVARVHPCYACRHRSCSGEFCEWLSRPLEKEAVTRVSAVRSPILARKLRAIILALVEARSSALIKEYGGMNRRIIKNKNCIPTVQSELGFPEMEGANGEVLGSISSANVVLTESNPASSTVSAMQKFSFDWHQLCSTDNSTQYTELLDRWTYFKTFTWKNTMDTGTEIPSSKLDLPYDFVNSVGQDGSMPMFVPFKIYKYFKSDIEIKIHVNSNKFQVGQLQVSWQYMEKFDGNPLDNIYSRSQLPHVLVNAGASNEATLYIPYKYVLPYLATHQRKNKIDCLYLGTLKFFVNSSLAVGSSGPPSCDVSVFVRFPRAEFTGLTDGGINYPQMEEAAAVMVAAKVVDSVIGDRNGDKKTENSNPSYFVPTGTHPWCAGKGATDRLMSLRLDADTIGVGRPGIDNSETSIGIPCRTFGMLKHFTWTSNDSGKNYSGYQLWSCDVHAQIEKETCYRVTTPGKMTKYAMPPMSVVAGLYKHWRGSIEFKFDIIASQFHTGRLLCAYIPGFYGDSSKITLAQARNCPYVEFSLQDSTSFTFVVPYISDTVWWDRKYTGPHKYGEHTAPSKLVLFILNQLIPMQDVIPNVQIIPYVRAGTDFEVSVPVQPSVGLSDSIENSVAYKDKIYPTAGSFPMRSTQYKGFGEDKYCVYYEGTAVFGTASTFHAPTVKLLKDETYYGVFENPTSAGTIFINDAGARKEVYIGYIVLWSVPDKGNFGIPFPLNDDGLTRAKKLATALKQGKSEAECLKHCYLYLEDGRDSASTLSLLLAKPKLIKVQECGEPEMDNRVDSLNQLQPTSILPSTSSGAMTFNETFDDLKDLARRYQLYSITTIKLDKDHVSGETVMVFPVIPHGLELDTSESSSTFNVTRDGHIPVISSGYIYFRGSIRFKLLFTTTCKEVVPGKIWVQHHPDADCIPHKVQTYPNISDEDGFRSHSYGFYIQNVAVNGVIEIEVPFYQPGMYGLTRKMASSCDDAYRYYTLGNIVGGLYHSGLSSDCRVDVSVYYSIGDDFSFNVFRGFPLVVATDEVWPPTNKNEKSYTKKKRIVQITGEPEMGDTLVGDPEMMKMFSALVFGTSTPLESVTSAAQDIAKHIVEEVRSGMKVVTDAVCDAKERSYSEVDINFVARAIGELLHILVSPTPKTLAVSIVNVIASLIGYSIVNIVKMVNVVTSIFSRAWDAISGVVTGEGYPEADDDNALVLGGLVFSAVSTLMGVTIAGPSAYPDIVRNISATAGLMNNVIRLLHNSSDLIMYSIRYISGKLYPELRLKAQLSTSIPEIKQWFAECNYLCDVRNKDKFLYDRSMMNRVFDACVVGSILVSNGIDRSSPGGKVIFDTFREMKKIRNDLFERGVHPDVRFECFPLWMSGEPGIGKSFLVKRLCNDLLKSVNYSQPGSLIYDIPSGAKYWSGCQNPAVLVSDDIFQVTEKTRRSEELANLFTICSSSVLNPPMAAVEDKERRINPLIYLMLCNVHYPNFSTEVVSEEAVYRRRKFLINAELRPELREQYPNFQDASDLPRSLTANMDHLQFRLSTNVKVKGSPFTEPMSYSALLDIVGTKFKKHYENERINFKQRMIDMYCLDPDFNEENIITDMPEIENYSLTEQIEFFKKTIQNKLDILEDPSYKDPSVWRYIRMFCDKVSSLRNEPQMETSVPTVDIPEEMQGDDVPNIIIRLLGKDGKLKVHTAKELLFVEEHYPHLHGRMNKRHCANLNLMEHNKLAMSMLGTDVEKLNFPYMYLRKLRTVPVDWFEETVNNHILSIFRPQNEAVVHDWIDEKLSKLLEMPLFSFLDKLRFLCAFSEGPRTVATILLNRKGGSCYLDKLGRDFTALTNLQAFSKEDRFAVRKNEIREALRNITFKSCATMRSDFYHTCELIILNEFVEVPEVIRDFALQFDTFAGAEYFANALVHLASYSVGKDSEHVKRCCNYVMKMYSCSLLSEAIFGRGVCNLQFNYEMLFQNLESSEYCAASDSITVRSMTIKPCTCSECVYSSHYLFYFSALVSKSCLRLKSLSGTVLEVDCVFSAAKRSARPLRLTMIDKASDWLECFLLHKIPKVVSTLIHFLVKILPYVLAIVASVFAMRLIGNLTGFQVDPLLPIRGYKLFRDNGADPEANYFKFDTPKMPTRTIREPTLKSFVKPEMSSGQRVSLARFIENNTVLVYATWLSDGQRHVRQGRCIMLRGRAMLIIRHYYEEYLALINEGHELEFKLFFHKNGRVCHASINWSDLVDKIAWCAFTEKGGLTSNYGIVLLPNYIPQFRDIVKRIATRAEHKNLPSVADLYVINGDSSFNMPLTVKTNFLVSQTENSSAVNMDTAYSYARQYKGLCGSVLVASNLGSGAGAIIGFHVAGNSSSKLGYSEPIVREMLLAYFEDFPETVVMPLQESVEDKPHFELDANMMMYGVVPERFAHKESGKSKIIPSLLAGCVYPVKTEVNPLRPNDPRQPPGSHPLKDGCEKHGSGDVRVFPTKAVQAVEDYLSDSFQQIVRPVRAKVEPLTMEQTVCGDVEVPYFEPLNWKSSEGFPLSSHRPPSAHDKRWLFDLEEGQFGYKLKGLNPMLEGQMKLRDQCFQRKMKPPTVYVDCLKDYRLTPEKCKQKGKTRIFSIAPIQCSLDVRMYMNDFCASLKNSRIVNSIAIGINPDSLEWTELVHYLFEVGQNIITLDYSNYGPCLMSQLVASSGNVISNWYRYHGASAEHVERVQWLMDCDIVNPVHLSGNVLYQTLNGIASGSPLTGECNSIPNLFYIRLTWLEIMSQHMPDWANMYSFDMFVRLVVYGDDLIMSVADDAVGLFNAISIKQALALHGIKVTPAQKDQEMVPYTSIYEATFLKRSFRHHPSRSGIWLAPIDTQSIEECINWIHISEDEKAATLESCRASLDLAFSQGPQYYKLHYNKIKRALNDIGLVIQGKNWYERDEEIFGSKSDVKEPSAIKINLPWTYALSNETL